MAMKYQFKNPETGGVGEIDEARVGEALSNGMQPLQALQMYNPETQGTGEVAAEQAAEAMKSGLLPVGSQEHRLATTSKTESFGRGALQGATLGFADEISGAIESAAGSLGLTDVDKTYAQARDESRANFDTAQQANPMTSLAGNVGGGLATMLIPGANMTTAGKVLSMVPKAGPMLAGSKIAQAGLLGAGMGAVQGAGSSRADSIGGVADDAAEGALIGGVTSGVLQGVTSAGGAVAKRAGKFLHESFEPTIQRMEAMGIRQGDLKKTGGFQQAAEGVQEFTKLGGFDNIPDELAGPPAFRDKLYEQLDMTADKMRQAVDGAQYAKLSDEEVFEKLTWPLYEKVFNNGFGSDRPAASKVIKDILEKVDDGQGSVPNLWDLKKFIGKEVSWASKPGNQSPPLVQQILRDANGLLDDIVQEQVSLAQQSVGGTASASLGELNKQYAKLVKLRPVLEDAADKYSYKGDTGANIRISEQIKGASLGAAAGSLIGVPGLGAAAGALTAVGGAAMRSTSGRLARAKVGEMLSLNSAGAAQKAAGDAAAASVNLIPRTLDGARQWMQTNADMVAKMPGMAQIAEQIMKLPDPAAEVLARATLPMVAQFVAPSPYQSEFNGKVNTPQDRVTARQVIMAQGLPPSVASYHLSMLNKSGSLQPYHYAKVASDYGDDILNFNERLTAMGY